MLKIFFFTILFISALPFAWDVTVDRFSSASGIDDAYGIAGRFTETSTAFAFAIDEVPAGRGPSLDPTAQARLNLNRSHFETVCWSTVGLFLLLAMIWPPAGIVWQRFKKAALAFVVLAVILSLCGWRLQDHFASANETASLVLGFSDCATLGMPFTATLADKLLVTNKATGTFVSAILNGIIGAGLGMILFMAGMYLVIFHTNKQYLNFLGI